MVYYLCQAKRQYARPCSMSVRFKADIVDAAVWQWVKGYLLDPERLAEGITSYAAMQQEENAPLQERLRVVEDLLRNNRTQLERLLDLYLGGEFSKELLTERKSRLETTISALDDERSGLLAHIAARSLAPEEVMELQGFAANVAAGLARADEEDYPVRRQIIETLRVEGTLAVEDGHRVLYVRCLIGEEGRFIVDRNKDEERGSRCHPGLPKPHGSGLNGLRRPSLVTGGAGLGLPPARPANASMRSHRLGSAPQLRSVLPRGRRRHCSDCRSLGCAVSLVLSPSTLLADVRMWRGGYHGPCDVSRRILADSNDTGPQSDTLWMPNYGPGPLPILTLDSARYLTRLSTFPATCLGRAPLGTPWYPSDPEQMFGSTPSWTVRAARPGSQSP